MEYSFIQYTKNNNFHSILRMKDTVPIQDPQFDTKLTTRYANGDMAVYHTYILSNCIKRDIDQEGFYYAWYTMPEHSAKRYALSLWGEQEIKGVEV